MSPRDRVRVPQPGDRLTAREIEIVHLVADGMTNDAVGQQLWLARDTVKRHMLRISIKLGARNRAQVVNRAWQLGYLKPGGDDQ